MGAGVTRLTPPRAIRQGSRVEASPSGSSAAAMRRSPLRGSFWPRSTRGRGLGTNPGRAVTARRLRPWATRAAHRGGSACTDVGSVGMWATLGWKLPLGKLMSSSCNGQLFTCCLAAYSGVMTDVNHDSPESPTEGQGASHLPICEMTANEVVAYNLIRARRLRGWTQGEAAARLERESGKAWTSATLGAAERSATSSRTRQFDANDLLTFSLAFDQPIAFFFIPPDISDRKIVIRPSQADPEDGFGVSERRLLDIVVPMKVSPQLETDVERVLNKSGVSWHPSPPRFDWYRLEEQQAFDSPPTAPKAEGAREDSDFDKDDIRWLANAQRNELTGWVSNYGKVSEQQRLVRDVVAGVFSVMKSEGYSFVKEEPEDEGPERS